MAHPKQLLDRQPGTGETVAVNYSGSKATVRETRERCKRQGIGLKHAHDQSCRHPGKSEEGSRLTQDGGKSDGRGHSKCVKPGWSFAIRESAGTISAIGR